MTKKTPPPMIFTAAKPRSGVSVARETPPEKRQGKRNAQNGRFIEGVKIISKRDREGLIKLADR